MKKCQKCKELKPLDCYYRCAAKPDGLQGRCKDCQRVETRERMRRRAKNPEASALARAKLEAWKEANPELARRTHAKAQLRYYHKNKEKFYGLHRRYFERIKDDLEEPYVRGLIAKAAGARRADVPQQLVEAKRAHLKVTRVIQENGK